MKTSMFLIQLLAEPALGFSADSDILLAKDLTATGIRHAGYKKG